jgi:hypothetical protein
MRKIGYARVSTNTVARVVAWVEDCRSTLDSRVLMAVHLLTAVPGKTRI